MINNNLEELPNNVIKESPNNVIKELPNDVIKESSSNTLKKSPKINKNSTYIETSKEIQNLRCTINPINKDNKCFDHSIALCKHKEMGANYNTVKKIKPCLSNFNFENIYYPLKRL